MDLLSAIVPLVLTMDPLGNIPLYLTVLSVVPPERRRVVLVREILLAYVVLLAFLLLGNYVMQFLGLDQATISVSGGIVLFLIAIRMIFPGETAAAKDPPLGEPFLVPLAIPLFAGPSVLATLLLLQRSAPGNMPILVAALTIAWAASAVILLASTFFYRILGERGLVAMERLMGMLLVMVAVQMFMNGVKLFLTRQ